MTRLSINHVRRVTIVCSVHFRFYVPDLLRILNVYYNQMNVKKKKNNKCYTYHFNHEWKFRVTFSDDIKGKRVRLLCRGTRLIFTRGYFEWHCRTKLADFD